MKTKDRFDVLISRDRRPSHEDLTAVFDESESISIEFLLGEWAGHTFGNDSQEEQLLAAIRWAGKTFRAANDVDPIVCLDEQDRRVANPVAGTAHLEMIPYRGTATATIIYHSQPMRDHFRRIDDDTVLGCMEKKGGEESGYFYLTRL